ncbi:MAG: hypothetical protein ACI8UR_000691, partial [Natronomonas sp.]|uniref:hypothetical protein n=1 Tax=Natronomonas sp. TaxID=2184060 RepID=UPI0039E3C91E
TEESWPVTLSLEGDEHGRHRAPAADDAVVVCLDESLPTPPNSGDVTLAPLCATKAMGNGPNYLVCRDARGF